MFTLECDVWCCGGAYDQRSGRLPRGEHVIDGIVEAAVVAEGGGTGSLFGVHSYRRTGDYLVTVTVTDEDGAVGSDNLRVRVNPSNTPPVADAQTVVVEQDTPTEILLTASDADGDNLTFEIVT